MKRGLVEFDADAIKKTVDQPTSAARKMGGRHKRTTAAVVVPSALTQDSARTPDPRSSSRGHTLLLVVFVVLCLIWLVVIIGLTVRPLLIMNALMRTEDFDYGTFWLVSKASPRIVAGGVTALVCVGAGYLGVLYVCCRLLRWHNKSTGRARSFLSRMLRAKTVGDVNFDKPRASLIERGALRLVRCFQDSSSDTQAAMVRPNASS